MAKRKDKYKRRLSPEEEFNLGIKQAEEKIEKTAAASDGVQLMEMVSKIFEMDDKEFEEQKEILDELFKIDINKSSLVERISQMNRMGETVEDLRRETEELREFSFDAEALGISEKKKEFLEGMVKNVVKFNEKVISYGVRPRVNVYFNKTNSEAVIPRYANQGDAGFDFYTCEDVVIQPKESVAIGTGIRMAIPEGYEVQIRPRSGWSLKEENVALFIANSPATIDAGYRGEIKLLVKNLGDKARAIGKGSRIAQGVLAAVPKARFVETEDVEKIGSNRGGGLGSTGET